jgi:ribosomal RNA-processing protein 1
MDLKLIAKALAASEPKTRSEGFIRMRSYLTSLASAEQLPHVWKSLFYCNFYSDLWMADKLHLETVQELESLYSVTQFDSFLWFRSFLEMMRNEWEGLDPVRIDKYMLLVRYMLRTILINAIKDTKAWTGLLSDFIEKSVYKAQSLLFHVADIYLEELPESEFKVKIKMILPFIRLMKTTRINHLADMVYGKIILKLVGENDERLAKWLFKHATSE